MENIKKFYGELIPKEIMNAALTVNGKININEDNLFIKVNLPYDIISLDINSAEYEIGFPTFPEKINGVLNYCEEPLCSVFYEVSNSTYRVKVINKSLYRKFISEFYHSLSYQAMLDI